MQSDPIRMRFVSDSQIAKKGVWFDHAKICCNQDKDLRIHQLRTSQEYVGVLQGSDDVIFVRFPGLYLYPSIRTIAMKQANSAESDADFDMYLRCGAKPTKTIYDHVANAGVVSEYLSVADPCLGDWYLAIHSKRGAGTFHLQLAGHPIQLHFSRNNSAQRQLRVGFYRSDADTEVLSVLRDSLIGGAKRLYAMTEGRVIIEDYWFYTFSTDCICDGLECDICFVHDEDTSDALTHLGYSDPTPRSAAFAIAAGNSLGSMIIMLQGKRTMFTPQGYGWYKQGGSWLMSSGTAFSACMTSMKSQETTSKERGGRWRTAPNRSWVDSLQMICALPPITSIRHTPT